MEDLIVTTDRNLERLLRWNRLCIQSCADYGQEGLLLCWLRYDGSQQTHSKVREDRAGHNTLTRVSLHAKTSCGHCKMST